MHTSDPPYLPGDDLLWRQLKTIPAFRALLRAVESRFYQQLDLPGPTLDVGCGDGHFAQMTFDRPLTAGIDPWWGPLQKANLTDHYQGVMQSEGHRLPFADNTFASAISNSVLEHIPHVQPVLGEIGRVLQPGGTLVITMPSHRFTENLGGAALFTALGMSGMAERYRRFFNRISRHAHTDSAAVWAERLGHAGFVVERWQYYFSPQALRTLEWGHVQGLPAAIMHALTGHWIIAPWASSLRRIEQWVRPYFEEEAAADGAYVLFIARKTNANEVIAELPPEHAFSVAEMREQSTPALSDGAAPVNTAPDNVALVSRAAGGTRQPPPPPVTHPPPAEEQRQAVMIPPQLWRVGAIGLALICAAIGQLRFSSNPEAPWSGIGWFAASGLLLFPWLRLKKTPRQWQWRWPNLYQIPSRRWLFLLALLLVLLAQSVGSGSVGGQRPFLAIFIWIGATVLAFWALDDPGERENGDLFQTGMNVAAAPSASNRTWRIAALLFVGALLPRIINLSTLPFILNGTEASLGLDVLQIAEGSLRHPFATGWLTNPTLPSFILALPVKVFGPSVFSLRVWSPLIGAVTVVAVYLFGRRLWDEQVGLMAALLLAGSHFHLHYSRLGLTNSWDALWALVTLGLGTVAWMAPPDSRQRRRWLWVGVAAGTSAYLFTASRLLPLMAAVLLLWALISDRPRLRTQGRHLLVAIALAWLIALPLLRYYNANPTILMERANALGIFSGQSDWLAQEAARTGMSQAALLGQQFWQAGLAFNGSIDKSPSYRTLTPLLSFVPALLYGLGLLIAAWRWRRLPAVLLLIWVGVTVLFAGAILRDPPQSHRLLLASPAVALLSGVALVTVTRILWRTIADRETAARRLLPTLMIIVGLVILNDLAFYFGRYPQQGGFADRNTEIAHRVADYLNELEGDWTAYFYGPPSMYVDFPTITLLAQEFQPRVNLFDIAPSPNNELPPASSRQQVFIFLPERWGEFESVANQFPLGQQQQVDGVYAEPLFYAYTVMR